MKQRVARKGLGYLFSSPMALTIIALVFGKIPIADWLLQIALNWTELTRAIWRFLFRDLLYFLSIDLTGPQMDLLTFISILWVPILVRFAGKARAWSGIRGLLSRIGIRETQFFKSGGPDDVAGPGFKSEVQH